VTTLSIRAHAKINPYLAVGSIRSDGYHDIDTVFQALELHDVVTVSPSEEVRVVCSVPSLSGGANLVSEAIRLCEEIVDLPTLEVRIEKNIPIQAGLGGGSSDVAAALKLFDKTTGGALRPHMFSIGLACGSDVPFFLGESTRARAEGRGELLLALAAEPTSKLVIAMPRSVNCDTADAYARLDAMPERPEPRPENMPYNDFERVAPCESLALIDRMRALGIEDAGLCGSGSAVYGFSERSVEIADVLRSEGYWSVSTSTSAKFGEPWTP
jgi:4-diphosphocytidyl-2-C-methyl-D-erythritol kinase